MPPDQHSPGFCLCPRCDYDLAGLGPTSTHCPECGGTIDWRFVSNRNESRQPWPLALGLILAPHVVAAIIMRIDVSARNHAAVVGVGIALALSPLSAGAGLYLLLKGSRWSRAGRVLVAAVGGLLTAIILAAVTVLFTVGF